MSKIIKTIAGSADDLTSAYKGIVNVSQSAKKLSSAIGNIDLGKFKKTFQKTSSFKGTSSIVDTSKAVKKIKLIPSSTDDILKNLDLSLIKKVDIDSLDNVESLSNLVDSKSIASLNKVSDSLVKTKKFGSVSGLSRRSESVLDNTTSLKRLAKEVPGVKSVDDVSAALKKSKGVASKVDDVAEDTGKLSKKVDDVADSAKSSLKKSKVSQFVDKYGGLLNIGVVGGYFLGMYISNKINNNGEDEDSGSVPHLEDPGSDIYPVEKFDEREILTEDDVTLLDTVQSKEVLIAVAIAFAMVVVL